jgi:hypothetical protein
MVEERPGGAQSGLASKITQRNPETRSKEETGNWKSLGPDIARRADLSGDFLTLVLYAGLPSANGESKKRLPHVRLV